MDALELPKDRSAITARWLRRALEAGGMRDVPAISRIALEEIGAGTGLVGEVLRCRLVCPGGAGSAPRTVIVKLPSPKSANFRMGRRQLLHRREHDFYRHVAAHAPVRSPKLFYGDFDARSHRFVLVLEDLADMAAADQISGAGEAEARRAVRAAARLHGRYWNRPGLLPGPAPTDLLGARYRRALADLHAACLESALGNFGGAFSNRMRRLAETLDVSGLLAEIGAGPRTFVHGDFRLDNMFFGTGGGDEVALIDWQLCGIGSGLHDVACFLCASVETDLRRRIERDAVREYHRIVRGLGAEDLDLERCWLLYRRNAVACLPVSVCVCGGLDLDDARGRRLAEVSLRRLLAAIEDLSADELCPGTPRGGASGSAAA